MPSPWPFGRNQHRERPALGSAAVRLGRRLLLVGLVGVGLAAMLPSSAAWACPMCADNLPGDGMASDASGGNASGSGAAGVPNVAQAVRDAGRAERDTGGTGSAKNGSDRTAGGGNSTPRPRANVARGFYWSILLMLAVPYTMLLGGGLVFWQVVRRRRAQATLSVAGVGQAE